MTELELISVSKKVGEPADCGLLIDVGSKELPDFSLEDCWKKKFITPLRDRLMIEWLFSHHSAKIQLISIQSQITKLIEKCTKSPHTVPTSWESELQPETHPQRIIVGISCKNGAQLSPCFVERLFDNLQCEPPVEGLTVRRHHWDALCGEWGKRKDIVWQHSRLPIKYTQEIRQAVQNRVWTNFPMHVNALIEDAFQNTPLSASVEIEDFNINFEAGTVFMKQKRQVYRIRSTVVSADALIKCYPLVNESYKAVVKRYQAAGILFYSVHPLTGEAVFLLGHITYAACAWCDFGGLRHHWERARYTAARECCEETLGILGSNRSLVTQLEDYKTNNAFKIVNEDTMYVSHFLRVRYHDYPEQFQQVTDTQAHTHLEVDEMRWFPLSSMKTAIQMALLDQTHITVHPIHKNGSIDTSCALALRTEFVHTMCMAQQLGFLKSIEHIARELHSKNAPQLPPYVSTPASRVPQEGTEGRTTSQMVRQNDTSYNETATGLEKESQVLSQSGDGATKEDNHATGISSRTKPLTGLESNSDNGIVHKFEQIALSETMKEDKKPKKKPSDTSSHRSLASDNTHTVISTPRAHKEIFYFGMGAGRFLRNAYKDIY